MAAVFSCLVGIGFGQTTFYWDRNGATTGAGTTPTGTWDTTSANWNTNSGGTTAAETFTSGGNAVFSAGTNATGTYTVTVSGTQNVSSINVQEGTPTFTGGTINFSDSTPDFTVGSGRTVTVNSNISGTNGLNKLGAGTLVFASSDKTYTGTTNISAGILSLTANQAFDTVSLTGGTLSLNNVSASITTLQITANSTIDFAGSSSTLNVTNLSISAGVTLTITNWANAADFFYTTNWTGATYNTSGAAPMNRIDFNGAPASATLWQGYDNQITPVPEPSLYGALLLLAASGFVFWRRQTA
ncbi:MAG: autotransporter-associated beta strand repeat-containing protein [Opitutaceae bacterium]|nr:autotransporter-associated beta strand repeat-containing protein [Opitutaceae bacterium]